MSKVIVWIDDDIDLLAPLVHPLLKAGYRILNFRTGQETIRAINQIIGADLILFGTLIMPDYTGDRLTPYTGLQFIRELREVHHVEVPIVVLSFSAAQQDVLDSLNILGVSDILLKPLRPLELKEKIETVLHR